jgi:rubrerythrin
MTPEREKHLEEMSERLDAKERALTLEQRLERIKRAIAEVTPESRTVSMGLMFVLGDVEAVVAALDEAREQARKAEEGLDRADSRIEELEGHRYKVAEPSPSGKMGWRCAACGHYTNGPVKARFDPCPRSPYAQLQDSRDRAEHERDAQAAQMAGLRDQIQRGINFLSQANSLSPEFITPEYVQELGEYWQKEARTLLTAPGPRAEALQRVVEAADDLAHQIEIGDYRDSLGHDARMLQPLHELRAAWEELRKG